MIQGDDNSEETVVFFSKRFVGTVKKQERFDDHHVGSPCSSKFVAPEVRRMSDAHGS